MSITTKTWYVTAVNTTDDLPLGDIQSVHTTLQEAQDYCVNIRRRALRIYECKCVDVVTAEVRRTRTRCDSRG